MITPDTVSVAPTEPHRGLRTTFALHLFLLLVAAAVLFFVGLGRLPLSEPDEGRNAEVAREMLAHFRQVMQENPAARAVRNTSMPQASIAGRASSACRHPLSPAHSPQRPHGPHAKPNAL